MYYLRHKKECIACRNRFKVGLHHMNYEHLGYERDEDLVPLCWNCHAEYHTIYGKGDMIDTTSEFIIEKQESRELKELTKHF